MASSLLSTGFSPTSLGSDGNTIRKLSPRLSPYTDLIIRTSQHLRVPPPRRLVAAAALSGSTGKFPSIPPSLSLSLSLPYAVNRVQAVSAAQTSPPASEETADLLDTVEVFDLDGKAIPISDLWKDRKAVVAFARHFGCVLCRKRADVLASMKDNMDKSGVALVLIGPGSVDQAKAFAAQTKFKGEVYADPNHACYDALKFVSGVSTTFTPKAGLKIIQLYMEGYRQDWKLSFEEDTVKRGGWQQGGILVAGPGKTNISYIHKDKEAGDDPDVEEIMRACCS